ncbi:MAG TPA: murein biosynthesis integral membrane protein MurJ [Xanthobacteraceae bacterium]|nr:murein biosynthesis integral membrane protein MurJ [Xanthobacteraceae bacterium]
MSLARDVTTVGAATLTSRVLGFLRDAGVAAVLGAGPLSDAYFAALQIPNLFRRLLAEGALNSAFVPMWLRIKDENGHAATQQFGEEVLSAMAAWLTGLAIICIIFAPAIVHLLAPGFRLEGERFVPAVEFVRLSMPYVAVSGAVAVAVAALNAAGKVAAAAFGLVVFNGVLVAVVLALVMSGAQATLATAATLSAAMVVAGLAQLLCVGSAWLRLGTRPRRLWLTLSPAGRRFLVRAIPGVFAGGIPQLKLMAGVMVASSSQAAVSWLYYANRLYELPLGVISIAIASVLGPAIAASVRSQDSVHAANAQSRALEIALALSLPAAIAFAVLSQAIAGGLFQRGAFGPRDTAMVAAALTAISAGLPGHSLEKVMGAVSFAHEDTHTPMYTALCGLATAVVGALILFPRYGHVGIAGAIALSGWIGATLLAAILWRRGWVRIEHEAWRRVPGIVLASFVMGAFIVGVDAFLTPWLNTAGSSFDRVVALGVMVAAGLGLYLACLQALGVTSVRMLLRAIRERF